MRSLKAHLRKKLERSPRIAFLGVGSEMRSDDAAGLGVCAAIDAALRKDGVRHARVFYGHTAPENLTGLIREFKPSLTVIIDAADLGRDPGEVGVVDIGRVRGASCSTHRLPMGVFVSYLEKTVGCECLLVGIQPASVRYGTEMAPAVRTSVAALGKVCIQSIRRKNTPARRKK